MITSKIASPHAARILAGIVAAGGMPPALAETAPVSPHIPIKAGEVTVSHLNNKITNLINYDNTVDLNKNIFNMLALSIEKKCKTPVDETLEKIYSTTTLPGETSTTPIGCKNVYESHVKTHYSKDLTFSANQIVSPDLRIDDKTYYLGNTITQWRLHVNTENPSDTSHIDFNTNSLWDNHDFAVKVKTGLTETPTTPTPEPTNPPTENPAPTPEPTLSTCDNHLPLLKDWSCAPLKNGTAQVVYANNGQSITYNPATTNFTMMGGGLATTGKYDPNAGITTHLTSLAGNGDITIIPKGDAAHTLTLDGNGYLSVVNQKAMDFLPTHYSQLQALQNKQATSPASGVENVLSNNTPTTNPSLQSLAEVSATRKALLASSDCDNNNSSLSLTTPFSSKTFNLNDSGFKDFANWAKTQVLPKLTINATTSLTKASTLNPCGNEGYSVRLEQGYLQQDGEAALKLSLIKNDNTIRTRIFKFNVQDSSFNK